MWELLDLAPEATDDKIKEIANRHVGWLYRRYQKALSYNLLVIFDSSSLHRLDANHIYAAVGRCNPELPLLLVLRSDGGSIPAAYLIAKLCRERSPKGFEVVVPREAKSAATLLCCGADRIHMGGLSELGPIDPQFGGVPGLALKHSLEHLAQLVSEYPGATQMVSEYLIKCLPMQSLGYYERVAESASHYAQRLLQSRIASGDAANNESIARHLVYSYKDHGFVIDFREAAEIFGKDVVQVDSPEYQVGNAIYVALDLIQFIVGDRFKRNMYFVGDVIEGARLYPRRQLE